MGKIIFWLVVIFAGLFALRMYNVAKMRRARGKPKAGRDSTPAAMVRCVACGHRCLIRNGRRGICGVRFNQGGTLRVPHGYVAALQCDPVEKKPFFHVLPGSDALTFGMLGCDFHCGYCQNWITSQALRDERAGSEAADVTAESLLYDHLVAVAPGEGFGPGGAGWGRISLAVTDEQLDAGIERLQQALS